MKSALSLAASLILFLAAPASAQVTSTGTGCGGLGMFSVGAPSIGTSFDFGVNGGPNGAAGSLFVGLPTAPIDLSIIGGNGCTLNLFSPVALPIFLDGAGSHTVNLSIVNDVNAIGATIGLQYAVIIPAVNPLGVGTSDSLTVTIQA